MLKSNIYHECFLICCKVERRHTVHCSSWSSNWEPCLPFPFCGREGLAAKQKRGHHQNNKQTHHRYLKSSIPAFQALSLSAVGNLRRRKEKVQKSLQVPSEPSLYRQNVVLTRHMQAGGVSQKERKMRRVANVQNNHQRIFVNRRSRAQHRHL